MRCGRCGRRTQKRTQHIDGTPYGPSCAARVLGKSAKLKAQTSKKQLELDFEAEYQEKLPLVVNPDHWQVIEAIQQQYKRFKL